MKTHKKNVFMPHYCITVTVTVTLCCRWTKEALKFPKWTLLTFTGILPSHFLSVHGVNNSSPVSSSTHCSGSGLARGGSEVLTNSANTGRHRSSEDPGWQRHLGKLQPRARLLLLTVGRTRLPKQSSFIDFKYSRLSFHGVERENKSSLPECQNNKLL